MLIDLSSNENPNEPSQSVIDAFFQSAQNLNRYVADEELNMLKRVIANYNHISEERIFIGTGTDFLIKEVLLNFSKNREIVTFNPTFFYSIEEAKYFVNKISKIQLAPPEYIINWDTFKEGSSLFILDYPNNPTGEYLLSKEILIMLLENKNNFVLIDEAYFEYSQMTFSDLLDDFSNLAILRTLDKAFALAGLRVSYLMAGDSFLKRLNPKNQLINRPACQAAIAAINDRRNAFDCVKKTIHERERLKKSIEDLGFVVFPSHTNFLLVKTSISEFALELKRKNILISDLSRTWFKDYYRIAVGSADENNKLLKAIKEIL